MAKGVKGSARPEEEKPIRTSFNIQTGLMDKVRYIGFYGKKDLTQIITEALTAYVAQYEAENGKIKLK